MKELRRKFFCPCDRTLFVPVQAVSVGNLSGYQCSTRNDSCKQTWRSLDEEGGWLSGGKIMLGRNSYRIRRNLTLLFPASSSEPARPDRENIVLGMMEPIDPGTNLLRLGSRPKSFHVLTCFSHKENVNFQMLLLVNG